MAEAAQPTETTPIECPICLTQFIDPKILDCQHSFCLKCLQELTDKEDPKTDITCPMCRRKTSIPDEGLSALLNFLFLSPLIDDVINLEGLKEDINPPVSTCEGCDEGLEAVSLCVDCEVNFCQTCLEIHAKLKSNRHHQIVNAVSSSSNERPKGKDKTESSKCRKHTDQELCFYCDTCDLLVCPRCAVLDHRASNHNLSEINESITSHRQAVEEALMKFDECRKQFQKVDGSIKHSHQRLKVMVDRTLRDIVAKEEEEIAKIRNASRLLQERVTQISQERSEEFDSIQISNRDTMSRAEQIVASVNDLMQHADDFELLDFKPKVMHNLTFHKELQFQTVQHSKSFIGFKGEDVVSDADLGEILKDEKWEVKTEFGKEGEGEGEFQSAEYVACFSNGDIVVTDVELRRVLSTYTSTGSYKSTGVQSGTEDCNLEDPLGVAVTSDDLLLVTDGQSVKVYDRELQYIRQFRPSQTEVEEQSERLLVDIAVDKKDRIAVADWGIKVISLHNMDGSIISTIYKDKLSYSCFLSVSSKERVIFTDDDNMKLISLDFMGNEVFNISTSIDGKPVHPVGVCCDDAGDIYVSIHNDKRGMGDIHHYDASGEHIGCVARGLYNPLSMTFTPTGDLIVADRYSVKILHCV